MGKKTLTKAVLITLFLFLLLGVVTVFKTYTVWTPTTYGGRKEWDVVNEYTHSHFYIYFPRYYESKNKYLEGTAGIVGYPPPFVDRLVWAYGCRINWVIENGDNSKMSTLYFDTDQENGFCKVIFTRIFDQ